MHPIPRFATVLAGLLLASACAATPDEPLEQARIGNVGVVDAIDGNFLLPVDAQGRINGADRAAALRTLADFGSPATTRARVAGAPPAARAELVRLLADAGVPPGHVSFGDDPASSAPASGSVRILLQRFEVTPPTCAGWPDIQKNYVENGPLLPLGCVTNRNLQLMVEDPRDLVIGRTLGPADAAREAGAVARYQADKVKPFTSTTATGGRGATLSKQ
ncbi:CpaD family pilus assembly protein (plasmid) [Skermanella rosea]|uniref:CpaD family pilus assembly lipoprotein n=1 Tax=Skermanella rosea TaxID=1817965 RepID=UPI001931FB2B|nr:CpaD family pilus assembly lipoprotein [Skermanella rosea]UEM06883.1 CpaD family pilus assembly protein [Skermanella rosea]